jgi:WD40 repeat protein
MTSANLEKFLELDFSAARGGIRKFPLTPVGDTGFMIATKDMLITLAKSLTEFVTENLMMTESEYTQLVGSRANTTQTFGPEAEKKIPETILFPQPNWTAKFSPLLN